MLAPMAGMIATVTQLQPELHLESEYQNLVLPLSAISLVTASIASAPGLIAIWAQIQHRIPRDNFYEDIDGVSSPEAIATFSNKQPKIAILLLSIASLGTSIALSTLSSLSSGNDDLCFQDWLVSMALAFVLLQAICLYAHHSPIKSHDLGIWAMLSSFATAIAIIFQVRHAAFSAVDLKDAAFVIRAVNAIMTVVLTLSCMTLPRRPEVSYNGHVVDAQMSVSFLSRNTWSWVGPLIDLSKRKGDLDESDVPGPDHVVRAKDSMAVWNGIAYNGRLLQTLMRIYLPRFLIQWLVTMLRIILNLGPFWAMLRLVEVLENASHGERPVVQLLILIASMATFSVSGQWMDSWIAWYSQYKLALPIRAQLSALVFEKSLKRKNVKMAEKIEAPSETHEDAAQDAGKDKKDERDPETLLKSRQAIVNLVGVDTRNISNMANYQYVIISSLGKLLIFSSFLIQIIGWLPFIVGMFCWALTLPFNTYAARLYIRGQEQLMKDRDAKLNVVNEALLGIRQIKFSALEKQWEKRIHEMRDKELATLKRLFSADALFFACWITSPILLAVASLSVYATVNGGISPSVAFTSLTIFKSLESTLSVLPDLFSGLMDTLISVKRIETYLNGPEMERVVSEGPELLFVNATISWPVDTEVAEEERFILRDLNLSFPAGQLSIISGETGTGKSLLLSAILGEADLLGGSIYVPQMPLSGSEDQHPHAGNWIVPGCFAYISQSPWLESASLRDNILFGLPFDAIRYKQVIEACALGKDLDILADGDQTKLGANGINLSGGQKWRVTLARAVYSRAEILVMDDIFSAVDAHVGRHIMEKCITGDLCAGRTRILVTHHVNLVRSKAQYLVELGSGTALNAGPIPESGHREESILTPIEEEGSDGITMNNTPEGTLITGESDATTSQETVQDIQSPQDNDKTAKEFIEKETRDKGHVKRLVYLRYLKHSGGWFCWIVLALSFTAFAAGDVLRSWWVKIWTQSQSGTHAANFSAFNYMNGEENHRLTITLAFQQGPFHAGSGLMSAGSTERGLAYYLWVYVAISFVTAVIGTLRFIWAFMMSLMASKTLFVEILFAVLRTPLRWVDTVPVGRILNRLTADFEVIDSHLNMHISLVLWRLLGLVGVCAAASFVSPPILPVAFLLLVLAALVGREYLAAARPVKRLESTSKSPVFEQFNATLTGIATIRSFRKTQTYKDRMYAHLDAWDAVTMYGAVFIRWMSFRMFLLGTIFTVVVGSIIAVSPSIDAALAGFTLSFAVDFAGNILVTLWAYTNAELDMNATERVMEYSELKTEPLDGEEAPVAWPATGNIEVKDLVISYADDLPPVLKGVSFSVADNERIGVVGRTGAGKSSLTLALFRFLEAQSGTISIDGMDISKIDLHSLRSRLAIIPQDPVLFSGTIRSNLDPFNERTDEELHDSLRRVHLVGSQPTTPNSEPTSSAAASTLINGNVNIFKDLSSGIAESGGNLSQGQRQLLCVARAIVSRPKIMMLDEATSAVDMATDTLIQRSIREEFRDTTLIVIAHRLSTIADFDRILVLSEGAVAEYGTPKELWEKDGGLFRDMCESSGERDKLREMIVGK